MRNVISVANATKFLMLVVFFSLSSPIFAQTGIDAATATLQSYFDSIGSLIMGAGGLVGLAGGLRVFIKWNQGDPDAMKGIQGWVGSMIFLLLVGGLVEAFVS